MVRRRQFIGVVGMALLAGCSGSSEENASTPEPTATATPSPTATPEPTPNPAAERRLEEALQAMRAGGEAFMAEMEKLDRSDEYVSFDTTEAVAQFDTAAEALDAAEEQAAGGQKETVQGARSLVAWLRPLVDALETYDSALDVMQAGNALTDDRRFTDAAEKYGTAVDLLGEAGGLIEQAETAAGSVDVSAIEDVDESDLTVVRDAMEALGSAIGAWTFFARGFQHWLVGVDHLLAGIEAYGAERYEEAVTQASKAKEEQTSAHNALQEGSSESPEWLRDAFSKMICAAKAYGEAGTHLQAAVDAQQRGNESKAEEKMAALQQVIDRC